MTVVYTNPVPHLDLEDAEIKKVKAAVLILNGVVLKEKEARTFPVVLELKRFSHCSSFIRLKRSIVNMQRMIGRNRPNKHYNTRPVTGAPTVEEMVLAEEGILKSVQYWNFAEEIQIIRDLKDSDRMF